MELRQLRYFVSVVAQGSMGRAALELGVGTSALSQQISRLEGELATRLLQRTSTGVVPTDAGLAFWRQAQLAIRHADDAMRAAQQARLSGHVSVGMAPSTTGVLGLPFMAAMRARYPDIRLHLVENLSGNLATMLGARQLDLAILFQVERTQRWSVQPLLEERLFLICRQDLPHAPAGVHISLAQLGDIPLILPSGPHGLRTRLNTVFAHGDHPLNIVAEIDGLPLLMDAVGAGYGATIQPGAAVARLPADQFRLIEIIDTGVNRPNLLVSLSDDELSPAGLATRVVLQQVAAGLADDGRWLGATVYNR